VIEAFKKHWSLLWKTVRQLSGDDAYERYLQHQAAHHPEQSPLSRRDFFRQWQERKWNGVKRCC
jgi:uncharacterized short protein YbdD (DUF466 family)